MDQQKDNQQIDQNQKDQKAEQKGQQDIMNGLVLILTKKNEGNKQFALKKYPEAIQAYQIAIDESLKEQQKLKDKLLTLIRLEIEINKKTKLEEANKKEVETQQSEKKEQNQKEEQQEQNKQNQSTQNSQNNNIKNNQENENQNIKNKQQNDKENENEKEKEKQQFSKLQIEIAQLKQEIEANRQLVCLLQNNQASAYLENMQYAQVIEVTTQVIKSYPLSVKAIFRRGCAYLQTHKIIEANEDFKNALALAPNDQEIKKVVEMANKRLQDPLYLNEIIRKGGTKFFVNDPYINDPKQQIEQKNSDSKLDKKFELNGVRDFDLKQAKVYREKFPQSIDMLYESLIQDSWTFIDKKVTEDFGFTKFESSQWFLLFGIYQTLVLYLNVQKEQLEEARKKEQLDQLFKSKFTKDGWFKFEDREIQCLYYKLYIESNIKIDE
ncbi:hypothetical protein PPERSA_07978 [Pseudocohnilembus persalinus]|uniref:Uncharacterized protein n=1 Tax=Pseudocohnilembus persalinus TaxID=266149 RepID=A0A0V0QBA3_PSEPJ|nr:hypothetical protein PPERSA_07978 [Pseudocohnilembus persalinus]|eukprot:KRW99493.1 hypothetical protein PPERSA_07978 [Pseudocohnilembus persalinus]